MSINYNGKTFRLKSSSQNGELDDSTVFEYSQTGSIVTCIYAGGSVIKGQLIGKVDSQGKIEMVYQQVTDSGELQTGKCTSIPELLPSGKIRLHESWQWTSGDQTKGQSVLEEL